MPKRQSFPGILITLLVLFSAQLSSATLQRQPFDSAVVDGFNESRVTATAKNGKRFNLSRQFFKNVSDLRPGHSFLVDEQMRKDDIAYRTNRAGYKSPEVKGSR